MATWVNDDGLTVVFGTDQARIDGSGSPMQAGEVKVVIVDIDLTELTDTSAIVGDGRSPITLPEGAIIKSFRTTVTEAATSGGSPTLDVGVIDASADSSGTDDDDGFVSGSGLTNYDAVGENHAGAGVLINSVLDADYYVAASYDAAAYTAGRLQARIEYIPTLNREDQ